MNDHDLIETSYYIQLLIFEKKGNKQKIQLNKIAETCKFQVCFYFGVMVYICLFYDIFLIHALMYKYISGDCINAV